MAHESENKQFPPSDRMLSISEATAKVNISRASLYRLIGKGELPVVKLLGRTLIDPNDLAALLARSKRSA